MLFRKKKVSLILNINTGLQEEGEIELACGKLGFNNGVCSVRVSIEHRQMTYYSIICLGLRICSKKNAISLR